jgi:tRNA(Ile)-lysidine synthase
MVILDFLRNGRYNPIVLNFHHGTEFGREARRFLRKKCKEFELPFVTHAIDERLGYGESKEAFWRKNRYRFFESFEGPIVTAHHLDDATEWWIFSSLHGKGKLIPYQNGNVIRPFLLTPKEEILSWAERKSVEYLDDPANEDEKYMRSIVRHRILPEALRVNPGLRTVVKKKIRAAYDDIKINTGL